MVQVPDVAKKSWKVYIIRRWTWTGIGLRILSAQECFYEKKYKI